MDKTPNKIWAFAGVCPAFVGRCVQRGLRQSSPEHNHAAGGATRSKHMDGTAFDIAMANHDSVAFEAAAREAGFLGFYPRSGFMHVDLGPARQWGERFAVIEALALWTSYVGPRRMQWNPIWLMPLSIICA